ncbi:MAG: hypothetical protein R3Y36_01880, partial [Spirochaetales bacterium]
MNKKYKMSMYKNKGQLLTSLCPWVIMAEEGVCLIKNGAFMCAYEFIAPDVDSASQGRIAALGNMLNNAILQLGEGWAVQFELQKYPSNDYPGSAFSNKAAFLVENQREENFTTVQRHFVNRYFLILTYALPSEIEQKCAGFFYRKKDKQDSANIGLVKKQLKGFNMECAKLQGILNRYMHVNKLNSEQLLTLLHSSVSLNWHDMKLPEEYNLFLDRVVTDQSIETSNPMKLGENYIPILA